MIQFQQCPECGRWFDLNFEPDADAWYYGHDCDYGASDITTMDDGEYDDE